MSHHPKELIDRVAQVFCDSANTNAMKWADLGEPFRDIYRNRACALADAGLLAMPEAVVDVERLRAPDQSDLTCGCCIEGQRAGMRAVGPPAACARCSHLVSEHRPRPSLPGTVAVLREMGWEKRPAPRVFFRDDEVPSGVRVMSEDGHVHPEPEEYGDGIPWSANFTTVEVMGPEEWQATVDRAREARTEGGGQS